MRTLTVKDVSELTGVSVRTLHYYDEIGLLSTDRSRAGYRLYTDTDLIRLQQILIGRSLGLALEDIRRALDDPSFDAPTALRHQREQLLARVSETHRMIASIDATLKHLDKRDEPMTNKDMFDGFEPEKYEAEAKQRWGETDAYKESARRTRRYGENDWAAIKAETNAIFADAAAAMKRGARSDSPEGLALAERHRQHTERWFYPCSKAMHANLADMWEADDRFRANIDKNGDGLTAWLANAVRAAAS
ncbi:MAG: MerR family transcriptional regulator [Alphaproteobacteria bacterium]|nr:MerR family transcriptional regulator [Alphaproteobacteria bacterium]